MPKTKHGFGLPRLKTAYDDPDKDGYPNPVDCSDHNPNKQGPRSWLERRRMKKMGVSQEEIDTKAAEAGLSEKEYLKKQRVERKHGERLERLGRKTEEAEAKTELMKTKRSTQTEQVGMQRQRLNLQKERFALQKQRQQSMPKFGGTSGLFGGGQITSKAPESLGKPPSIITPMPGGFGLGPKETKVREVKKRKRRKKAAKKKKKK